MKRKDAPVIVALLAACALGVAPGAWAEGDDDEGSAPASESAPSPPSTPAEDPSDTAPDEDAVAQPPRLDPATLPDVVDMSASLTRCRGLLLDVGTRGQAAACYRALGDALDGTRAEALARFADAAGASKTQANDGATQELSPVDVVEPAPRRDLAERILMSGLPELTVSGTLLGAVSGYLASSFVLAATRWDSSIAWPILLASPAGGALAGLALSGSLAFLLGPNAGDGALVSSSAWWGTAYGVALQWLMFSQSEPISVMPWRFGVVLGSGLAGGGLAALLAAFVDVEPGDVGVANSAALWGGVLASFALFGFVPSEVGSTWFSNGVTPSMIAASSLLSYVAALSLSPFYSIPRPYTWLIEAGGVAGFLSLGMLGLLTAGVAPGFYIAPSVAGGAGILVVGAGVATGALASVLLSRTFAGADPLAGLGDGLAFEPMILLPAPRLADSSAPPTGLTLRATF